MIYDFSCHRAITESFDDTKVCGDLVEQVADERLLGFQLSNDMKPHKHVQKCLVSANKGLFLLYKMRNMGMPRKILVSFYQQYVQAIIENMAPAFHHQLTQDDAKCIERIRKRASRCVAEQKHFFPSPTSRREKLCFGFFRRLAQKGSPLFPSVNQSERLGVTMVQPHARTERYRTSFVLAETIAFNQKTKKSRQEQFKKLTHATTNTNPKTIDASIS